VGPVDLAAAVDHVMQALCLVAQVIKDHTARLKATMAEVVVLNPVEVVEQAKVATLHR
jgi:hypothetical protein